MKKFLLGFIVAVTAMVMMTDGVLADTATVNGITWTYTVSGGKASIYNNDYSPAIPETTTGAITIPSSLGGYPVTSIRDSAFYYCDGITSVRIPNSVTTIGDRAFYYCDGLKSITIPDSVTSIGDYAFYYCEGLKSITIPDSVMSIGDSAFQWCDGLTSVTIGNSVTSIGDYAFDFCSSLTSITIPDSVTSIGESAFWGCNNIKSVTVGQYICSNGLDVFPSYQSITNVVILKGVTSIGNYAFQRCSGLKSVTIPNSVTSIGWDAFSGCSGLTSITIPNSVTSIDYSTFEGCNNIKSVTVGQLICSSGLNVFPSYQSITNVVILKGVTSIGNYAFQRCSGLKSVTIPNSVTSIGWDAFSGCSGLTSITIPNSVTSIGDDAFYNCNNIKSVTVGQYICSNGLDVFPSYKSITHVVILKGVTSIGNYAFQSCSGLKSVTIPNSVTSIGDSAFYYCDGLTSVTIPNSVTSIGDYAFYNCSDLTSVTIPNSVTSIGYRAFFSCDGLKSVTIPNSVTSIGDSAFYGCSGLTSVTIPDSVTSIGFEAFSDCYGLTSVTIGNSVTSIGYRAFYECSGLTSITIPNSVTSIGDEAFYWCHGLTSITIGNSVTSIGYRAFSGCSSLTRVTIGNSVTSIGECAFQRCSGLKSVTIPNSVTSIGSSAFKDCSGLTSVTIGNSVTSIARSAFNGCHDSLFDTTTIPGVKLVDGWVVDYTASCPSVLDLTGVRGIGSYAFEDCYGLTSVTIGNSVTSIGYRAFSGCSGLTSVTIPDSVTSIGDRAFYNCSGLTSVTIPDSVTSIGEFAFYNCSGLTKFIVDLNNLNYKSINGLLLTKDGKTLIAGVNGNVVIPDSVTSIGHEAFYNCNRLTSITIPNSVTSIGLRVFDGCTSLKSVTIGAGVSNIDNSLFSNCPNMEYVVLPESFIGKVDFEGIQEVYSNYKCVIGGDAIWFNDNDVTSDKNGSLRSGKISNNQSTYLEMYVEGAGRLSYKWKASSEYYVNEIYDYGYLSLDGKNLSTYNDNDFTLSGIGIGGDTDWQYVELDITDAGSHIFRWTYCKDDIDETNVGEDCIWVDEIKFQPMNTLTFNLGGGIGTAPDSINALSEAEVILPNDDGFTREYYSFSGWSDGVLHYNAGDSFVMPATNLIMTAQWVANTLVAPTITSDDVTNGGVLSNASTIVSITAEDGVEIYYTIDGTTPSTSSIKYSTPFTVDTLGATVIKAIAVRDNYFDSEVSTFTFSRIPHSIGECLNADGLTLTTGGTSNWYRVVGDVAHDGIAALRSGAIGDNESTFVKATVSGEGTISFWWKSSSEINRKRKYDYVSFTVDGVEQAWLGGDTDWTNIVCEIAAAGVHTLEWTYQKNASNIMFEDCAWLDEVSWIPSSQGEAIPELPSSATADDVANALADSTDANLVKNITSIEMYSAYREWALSVKNASGDEVAGVEAVKASTTAWMSFALDQSKLIANEPVEGDVAIASLDAVAADGSFEFTVNINQIDVGDGAVEENLKKLFRIEGATSLGNDANFSSENVEIELAEPVNGDVKFKILPKDSPDSFFIRAKLLK